MVQYKLTYFNLRGRAEVTRMLFAYGEVEYDDVRLTMEEWKEKKEELDTPFGQLPILEFDGIRIAQSHTIERFVAKKLGLYGKDELEQSKSDTIVDATEDIYASIVRIFTSKEEDRPELWKKFHEELLPKIMSGFEKLINSDGFLVCDKIMLADITLFAMLTNLPGYSVDEKVLSEQLEKNPKVKALKEKVQSNPKIVKWLQDRPESQR